MKWLVESYISSRGDRFVVQFVGGLPAPVQAKVLRSIDLLKTWGPNLRMPHSKKVSRQIYELRVTGNVQVRILYAVKGNVIILLHGLVKKTAKLAPNDLRVAEERLANI